MRETRVHRYFLQSEVQARFDMYICVLSPVTIAPRFLANSRGRFRRDVLRLEELLTAHASHHQGKIKILQPRIPLV